MSAQPTWPLTGARADTIFYFIFIRIPKTNIKFKWITIIRKLRKETDWLPTKNTRLCNLHFNQDDFS